LEQGNDLQAMVKNVTDQFEVSASQAQADIEQFLEQLDNAGLLIR